MKMRTGFVSNSSCASFVIQKEWVSTAQIKLVKNHLREVKLDPPRYGQHYRPRDGDEWAIHETDTTLEGSTIMDNIDMRAFLAAIGVPMDHVEFDDNYATWHEWGEL